jgi:hypothetical protein
MVSFFLKSVFVFSGQRLHPHLRSQVGGIGRMHRVASKSAGKFLLASARFV